MLKKTFECDVCHSQRPIITRLSISLNRLFILNGNGEKPLTSFQSKTLEADVCSESCAMIKASIIARDHFTEKEAPCIETPTGDIKP